MAAAIDDRRGTELTPERWKKIDDLVQAALERSSENRGQFLDEACTGDHELRREVEALLSLERQDSGFLESPAVEAAADMVSGGYQSLIAGTTLGRYRIERRVGAGGMGEVFLALDTHLGRRVALKVLPDSFGGNESRTRFLREARLASSLDHPNICTIHEIGEDSGHTFISMQYIEGQTLKELMGSNPLEPARAISIALQIADALATAHERGIVHRDIKSSNIMITPRGQAKVLDFGLAKSIENSSIASSVILTQLTQSGAAMGTPAYMSPEQARGERAEYRSDVFSLGAVLYEMATGRLPFKENSAAETMNAIINKPHSSAISINRDVPQELSDAIDRALAKQPADRYPSMREMIADLRSCARGAGLTSSISPEKFAPYAIPQKRSLLKRLTRARAAIPIALVLMCLVVVAVVLVQAGKTAPAVGASPIKSLAVLPFRSLDRESNEDYLGLGIATDIITKVSQNGEVSVRPTSAVRKYLSQDWDALAAARDLKVDAVLDSSFLHVGDRLRVSVNLLRVEDGESLWAEKFDERFTDIFAIQDKVSQQVAERLRLSLGKHEQARLTKRYTSSSEAYNYYTKAMYHFVNIGPDLDTRSEADLAIDLFNKAIEIDPNYALAHAQLGYAYVRVAVFQEDNPGLILKAKEEFGIAERMDPQLAQVHAGRYFIEFGQYGGWRVDAGIRELRLAQQLDPSVGHGEMADVLTHIGLEDEAAREFETALKIDPNDERIQQTRIALYYITGRADDAAEVLRRYFNREPDYRYYLEKGMVKEARPLLERAYEKNPNLPWIRRARALLLAIEGKHHEAQSLIPSLLEKERSYRGYHHDTYDIARIYALGGKAEDAVKWLRETAKEGFPCYPLFARDPFLARIRNNPIFAAFLSEMKERWEDYRHSYG